MVSTMRFRDEFAVGDAFLQRAVSNQDDERQDRGMRGFATFARKLRVYDVADQDGLADWMRIEFPGMFYILSRAPAGRDRREAAFRGMYLTGDESLASREWIDEHVRSRGGSCDADLDQLG